MPYEPFLIAPFGTGLDSDVEPWMAPVDAFTDIKNGHIHHGYIEKRQGYRFLACLVHGQVITGITAASPPVFTPNTIVGLYLGQEVSLHYLAESAGNEFSALNAQKYLVSDVDQGAGTFELTDLDGNALDTSASTYTASSGRLGTCSQLVETQTAASATAADPAVFTVSSIGTIVEGDFLVLRSLTGGTWSTLNAVGGTATNVSGATFSITKENGDLVDGTGLGTLTGGSVDKIAPSRVMGLPRYIAADNSRDLLAGDKERMCIYNSAANLFEPLDLDQGGTTYPNGDHFAGTDNDYLWWANWQHAGAVNRVYITNGKAWTTGTPGTDGILYYDATTSGSPATPSVYQFNPSTGGSDFLYGTKLIFSIRQRLVCLHTFEFINSSGATETFPQRARWCAAQDPSNWDDTVAGGGGFVDAPTGEQIISARQLQDVIIVHFTDSVWTLRPVSDPALPFRWDQINSFRACDGKMASVAFDRYSLGVGIRGITATDGVETRRVDDRVEDFVTDDVNDSEFNKLYVARSYGNRRTWILYPDTESDDANSSLIYDDESGAYSKYEINMNVLGQGGVPIDYAAQDFTVTNDLDISARDLDDETALSFYWSKNAEIFLGGDRQGQVHILETGLSDDGTSIDFSVTSAAWNPYKEQSLDCQFGYIDLFVDSDQDTQLTVSFYKDNNEFAYETQTLDCLPNLNYRSSIANIVMNADPTVGVTVTAQSHGLSAGETFYAYGVEGAKFYNDLQWTVGATVDEDTFTIDTDMTSYGAAITAITAAEPPVVTAAAHGFSDGDIIYIVDVGGMIEVNDLTFEVANSTTNTFELKGIDGSGYTAYTTGGYAFYKYLSGGKIVERKFYRTKCWKRAYAGGMGYQHHVKIANAATTQPLQIHALKPWFQPRGRRILG